MEDFWIYMLVGAVCVAMGIVGSRWPLPVLIITCLVLSACSSHLQSALLCTDETGYRSYNGFLGMGAAGAAVQGALTSEDQDARHKAWRQCVAERLER